MLKNVLLISADFPKIYYKFAQAFKKNGCNVFVIGSTPIDKIEPELKEAVTEYVFTLAMEDIKVMIELVGGLIKKYGPIDFIESNNEYWLKLDATLREWYGIKTGIYPNELQEYQKKSSMKKAFEEAGAHYAPYVLATDLETVKEFAKKYGYPIFAKPNIGVGAAGNYKIQNDDDLEGFFRVKPNVEYIIETFVEGKIITFDGIANENSETVIEINEIYQREVYSLISTKEDMYYYVNKVVPEELSRIGKSIVKALKLKNRFFHIELFIADNEIEGSFKKGDYVVLEANIRVPGDYTPDVLNYGLSSNIYQMYADVMCFGKTDLTPSKRYYAMSVSRRNGKQYFFSDEDIKRTFAKELCETGTYPDIFSDLIGNYYYVGLFEDEESALLFSDYIRRTNISTYSHGERISHVVGEDRRMLQERKEDDGTSDINICDKHIDGA